MTSCFLDGSVGQESSCNEGNPSSIPGSGRSTGEGIGYPLQYSWASLVTQLVKNLPAMWETGFDPWVGKIPLEKGKATPVFWPREFHRLYSPWSHKESGTTERLSLMTSVNINYLLRTLISSPTEGQGFNVKECSPQQHSYGFPLPGRFDKYLHIGSRCYDGG